MVVQTLPVREAARPASQTEQDWKLRVARSDFGVIASYIRQLSDTDRRSRPG